ncbi:hypothetical protein [Variovorax atrisoli]|uniref:hypothetical protein n=1 Tax=Variovorax atrisoli TaxID=3394203 RepID=UPI0019823557|nr:hypothetical protein [Variovorax sp. 369]
MKDVRIAVAALTFLAAGFAAWMQHEGSGPVTVRADGVEVLKPYVPTQGDVPTIGEPKRFRVLRSGGGKTKLSDKTVTIAVTTAMRSFKTATSGGSMMGRPPLMPSSLMGISWRE